jgi:hypothetical protein
MDNELYKQLDALIAEGDEVKTRRFVLEHLKEFPEKDREQIMGELVQEAFDELSGASSIHELQKQGLAIAESIENAQEKLEDKKKMLDIKESL